MIHREYKQMHSVLGIVLLFFILLVPSASAFSYSESYIPPEAMYKRQLKQRIALPQRVDVNRASLSELLTLPGFDESIALKLMRMRPIENIQEFHNMPWTSPKEVQVLIERIQHRVEF